MLKNILDGLAFAALLLILFALMGAFGDALITEATIKTAQ